MLISVEAVVNAPVKRAWECWTSPEHIVHWNFASADWCCPKAENDLTINGKFNYRMEAVDGSVGFDFTGSYRDFKTLELLSIVLDDNRSMTVLFRDEGDKTTIVETFEAEDINSVDLQRQGWQAILNNFKAYVES